MQELRANTEVIVTVGPFLDVGDGFTPQTDITLGGDEAELMKHGGTVVVDISAATWAAVANCRGYYSLTLTASHTDTEGLLVVIVQDDSDCLPVKAEYMVLSEAAWDSKYVAKDDGFMDVNVKTVGRADTQETEANNLEAACAAYSATRGLTGTALPAAAANAAAGLPISAAGGLDLDTLLARLDAAITSRNATVPDAAGTAAALHAVTDGLIGALVVPDAAGVAAGLHAVTDGLIGGLVVPDAAGVAAGLHAVTDGLIGALVVPDAAGVAAGLHGVTDGLIGGLVVPDAAGTAAALHAVTDALIGTIAAGDATAANQVILLTRLSVAWAALLDVAVSTRATPAQVTLVIP